MKHTMNITRQIFSVALALFCSSVLASAIPGRAEVKKVVGPATVAKATGGSSAITQGMVLGAGDTITTGAGSTVDIDLGVNGNYLRIDPDTTLKLDVLDIANVSKDTITTSMSLAKGSVTGNVTKKLTAASKYEIKTASGVAGVRGTVYSIRTDGTLVVLRGTVDFVIMRNGQQQVVRVTEGQQFKAGVDTAPVAATGTNKLLVIAAFDGATVEELNAEFGTGGAVIDAGNPLAVSVNSP